MTKETGQQALRIFNAAMSGIAMFLLIGVYNRFEKLVDKVETLQTNQTGLTITQDFINKKNSMIESTFENQLKTAKMLMEKIEDCDLRLDYIEMYVDNPRPRAAKKK